MKQPTKGDMRVRLEKLGAGTKKLRADLKEARSKLEAANDEIRDLKVEADNQQQSWDEEQDGHKKAIDRLLSKNETESIGRAKAVAEVRALQAAPPAQVVEIRDLEDQVERLKATVERLKGELAKRPPKREGDA